MKDLDFLKWVFDKAGLKHRDSINGLSVCIYNNVSYSIGTVMFKNVLWSYALQRAIEGVNRENKYRLEQSKSGICYGLCEDGYGWTDKSFLFNDYNWIIDNAKESALKYIYEQETNNGS